MNSSVAHCVLQLLHCVSCCISPVQGLEMNEPTAHDAVQVTQALSPLELGISPQVTPMYCPGSPTEKLARLQLALQVEHMVLSTRSDPLVQRLMVYDPDPQDVLLYRQAEHCLVSENVEPLHGLEMYWLVRHEEQLTQSVVSRVGLFTRRHLPEMYLPNPQPPGLQVLQPAAARSSKRAVPEHTTLGSM